MRPWRSLFTPLAVGLLVGLVAGCEGGGSTRGTSADAGAPTSSSPATSAPSTPAPSTSGTAPPRPPSAEPRGEVAEMEPPPDEEPDPRRAVGARLAMVRSGNDETVVAKNEALFTEHFGGAIPFPLELREVAVAGGRRALLFTSARPEDRPLVVLADATGRALWQKERPLAGTHELWRGLTITTGPGGAVLLFWWDVTSRAVAGRQWGYDGSIFADYHFFDAENVTGLDALHWPGHGWVVTVTSGTTARSAMMSESGFRGFGGGVVDVGGAHEILAPATAAAGVDGVFFAYVGRDRVPGNGPPHLFVTLVREDGSAAWGKPTDLGPVTAPRGGAWPSARVDLATPVRARVSIGGLERTVQSDGRVVQAR